MLPYGLNDTGPATIAGLFVANARALTVPSVTHTHRVLLSRSVFIVLIFRSWWLAGNCGDNVFNPLVSLSLRVI